MLPAHGWITCRRCFSGDGDTLSVGRWKAVNDPGAWGSATPNILVLGFSKGFTQANEAKNGRFENVPFKDARDRLTLILHRLRLLDPNKHVDDTLSPSERVLAYGSLIRCSLSRLNEKSQKYECTGQVMPKAFSEEIRRVVEACTENFLCSLPPTVQTVVLLGATDGYIKAVRKTIRALHQDTFRSVNEVAYQAAGALWVHVHHPSRLNGHLSNWLEDSASKTSGRKRELALEALKARDP